MVRPSTNKFFILKLADSFVVEIFIMERALSLFLTDSSVSLTGNGDSFVIVGRFDRQFWSHLHEDQTVLSQMSPIHNNTVSQVMERPLHSDTPNPDEVLSSHTERTSRRQQRRPVHAAFWPRGPDSAAGPPGVRPRHIKGRLLPEYRDDLMRSLHAVLRIMAKATFLPVPRSQPCLEGRQP